MNRFSAWRSALRALRAETFEFRFKYPVEEIQAAGDPNSLDYYIYAPALFGGAMVLDAEGVPIHRSRKFVTYNPAYVAWYGLTALQRWLITREESARESFERQVAWLVAHAVELPGGGVVWQLDFDWREGRSWLAAPWISAMAQGLAISALVRAYRLNAEEAHLELARAGTRVFESDVEEGGVRTHENGHAVYEEYPAFPLPRVLDGFLFSLLGLYDLYVESGDERVRALFNDGVAGLVEILPRWDYRGRWSWYGTHGYLCPPHYNSLNVALLRTITRLSGEPAPADYAAHWSPNGLSLSARIEVFTVFLLTKNLSRLRHLRLGFQQ